MPPTRMTSLMSLRDTAASLMAFLQGSMVRSMRFFTRLSSLVRVNLRARCLGPEASAVMKGKLISVWRVAESSILAFSAASRILCRAMRSFDTSTPCERFNSSTK